jgi:hypothetical protein
MGRFRPGTGTNPARRKWTAFSAISISPIMRRARRRWPRATSAGRTRRHWRQLASSRRARLAGRGTLQPSTRRGALLPEYVRVQDPTNANCAQCHGLIHTDAATPLTLTGCDTTNPQTATTGQVISGQKIAESGVNIVDKASLSRAWDVHAERQLDLHRLSLCAQQPDTRAGIGYDAPQPPGLRPATPRHRRVSGAPKPQLCARSERAVHRRPRTQGHDAPL